MADELELSSSPDGTQVIFRGRKLYSSKPIHDASFRTKRLAASPDSIILWQSPLLWYGLDELLQKAGEQCWVIGIEAEPALLRLAREHLPQLTVNRVSVVDTGQESIASVLSAIETGRYRRVIELTTGPSAMLHRDTYRRVRDLLDRQIQIVWQNRLTLRAMGRLWIRNIACNIPRLMDQTPVPYSDKPVVVAGAGPSLDRSIGLLCELRDQITLVAVDTALPALAGAGIYPEMVVAVEAQLANAYDFLGSKTNRYTLVADLGSAPAAVSLHSRCAWVLSRYAAVTVLDRVARLPGINRILPPLGSVGVTAVTLALSITSNPVFLTGLDFAVNPGQTHARGTPSALWRLAHADRFHPPGDYTLHINRVHAPSAIGGMCETTLVLSGYAKELARAIGSRTVFQIEPSGLPVGATAVSTDEAAERIRRLLDTNLIDSALGTDTTRPATRAELAEFIDRELSYLDSFLSPQAGPVEISACDYLYDIAGFHGESKDARRSESVRVLASYFLERWQLSRSLVSLHPS